MPHTILIVDDEPTVGQMAARILRNQGYAASATTSPRAALDLLAGASPCDMLIVDVRMPAMDGFQLAHAAWVRRPALPVLFITGWVDRGCGGEGGFHDFLPKPFTAEQLVTVVHRLLS